MNTDRLSGDAAAASAPEPDSAAEGHQQSDPAGAQPPPAPGPAEEPHHEAPESDDTPGRTTSTHTSDGARDGASPPAPVADGGGQAARSAEALAAAVRAVESGERPAASFFTQPARPVAPSRPDNAPVAGAIAEESGRPVEQRAEPGAEPAVPGPSGSRTATVPEPVAGHHAPRPGAEQIAHSATVREILTAGGAPETLAGAVVDALGERAAQALREDPWQLLAIAGVRVEQADAFARALLGPQCGPGDERRTQALISRLLERAAWEGHTALEPSTIATALTRYSVPDPEEALHNAIADGGVLVFQDALDSTGTARTTTTVPEGDSDEEPAVQVLVGLDRYALAEESVADGLARLLNSVVPSGGSVAPPAQTADGSDPSESPTNSPPVLSAADWEVAAQAAVSPSAAELIRAVAAGGLVTHTGGEAARAEPAALIAAARALGLRAYGATHSEDGRRRLADLLETASSATSAGRSESPSSDTADAAVTLDGLLQGHAGPGRDPDGALALDVLAVLDAPQLDVESAAMLVESVPDGTRLVLSGDPGVLWSAGPGRVFADLLAARVCPQVASRTPDPGPLGELVSGIGAGELNEIESPGKEIMIVPVRDAGEAVHRTVQLVADSVPRAIGVPPDRTQVITPGHGGAAGTRALNTALKARLNPGPGRFAGFDPGDRVAYIPAPGRAVPGTVVSADAEGLRLDCGSSAVVVPRERVGDTVRHGWALTAHQAAGIRWPAAVVVLPGDAAPGLSRSWVYTAFGRGEQHLSVVHGADQDLPRAVRDVPVKERTSRLRTLLRTLAPPAG